MESTVVVDTEKFMGVYSQLSQNKLEVDVARAYEAQVRKDVKDAQDRADMVVNALTSRSKPPDFAVARSALKLLASGPATVVAHWQKFIAAIAEVLPPREEGEVDDVKVVDSAAETAELKDLRAILGQLGAVLPLASARELRELREGFAMLGEAIGAEFGKRGMPFERDGSAAALDRIIRELEVALAPGPLPKDFAFSDLRVMNLRAALDQTRGELAAADARIAEMKDDVSAGAHEEESLKSSVRGLEAQVAALTTERDSTMQTRLEISQVADRLEKQLAETRQLHDAEMKRNTELEVALTEAKKRAGELEHEVEQLKKKSSKSR